LRINEWLTTIYQLPFTIPANWRLATVRYFMQNKPNFRNDKMNITLVITEDYENKRLLRLRGKQTQTNPTCSELACPELVEGVEPISNVALQKWAVTSIYMIATNKSFKSYSRQVKKLIYEDQQAYKQ